MTATTMYTTADLFHYISLLVADRLHTMRTLRSLPVGDAEKLKIAEEALNVYAPLAHRMGMMKVKGELEDLAFKHLHPEIFQVSFRRIYPRQFTIPPHTFLTFIVYAILLEYKIHTTRGK